MNTCVWTRALKCNPDEMQWHKVKGKLKDKKCFWPRDAGCGSFTHNGMHLRAYLEFTFLNRRRDELIKKSSWEPKLADKYLCCWGTLKSKFHDIVCTFCTTWLIHLLVRFAYFYVLSSCSAFDFLFIMDGVSWPELLSMYFISLPNLYVFYFTSFI